MYGHPDLVTQHAQALAPPAERPAQICESAAQQHTQAIAQLIAEHFETISLCED